MRVHGHSAAGPSAGCEAARTVTSPRTLRRPPRTPAAPGSGVPGRGPHTPRTRKRAGEGAQPPPRPVGTRWRRPAAPLPPGDSTAAPGRKGAGALLPEVGATEASLRRDQKSLDHTQSEPAFLPIGCYWEESVLWDHLSLSLSLEEAAP